MKQYIPEKIAAQSRYRRYFPTLPADVRADAYARMRELVEHAVLPRPSRRRIAV